MSLFAAKKLRRDANVKEKYEKVYDNFYAQTSEFLLDIFLYMFANS